MKKYYFITYQAKNIDGDISIWNQVTYLSPMEFIKDIENHERSGTYDYFRVINTCEISLDDYLKFKDEF